MDNDLILSIRIIVFLVDLCMLVFLFSCLAAEAPGTNHRGSLGIFIFLMISNMLLIVK